MVRHALPPEIEPIVVESRFPSRGIFRRVYNAVEASLRQGEVNHIAGDVHFLSFFLNRKKTILTIADCVFAQRRGWIRKQLIWLFWYAIPIRRANIITVISEATKKELQSIVNCENKKIRVVHCCIPSGFSYMPNEFHSKKPRILQVGTGDNKNLIRVVRALEGIPCHLDIVGKLTDEQKRVLDECSIEYSNSLEISEAALIGKYQQCDIVTFVSIYEGFGLPILEGNAIGRPVITSSISSMPEVAGDAACFVDPFDVQDIRRGILKVIGTPDYRRELVARGIENAVRFRPEKIAAQYAALYQEVNSYNRRSCA